jgi:hypothetical protein
VFRAGGRGARGEPRVRAARPAGGRCLILCVSYPSRRGSAVPRRRRAGSSGFLGAVAVAVREHVSFL